MSEYKLIAFDMDGTLLDSGKKISPVTLAAVNSALAEGKHVVLCTGRGVAELRDFLPLMPELRYVVCVSGALVYDVMDGKVIYSCPVPRDTVSKILNLTKPYDIMIQFLTSDKSVVEREKQRRMKDYQMSVYQSMYDDIVTHCDDIREYFEEHESEIYKVNLYHTDADSRLITKSLFKDLEIESVFSERTSLECTALGISKGSGLSELCKYLSLDMSEVIAVGDADNDLDVLSRAGLAIAMGNANDNVKRTADKIVADNDHDGCAEALAFLD